MGREHICDFGAALPRARARDAAAESKADANRRDEIAELERKAIASLKECAEAVSQIARLVDDAARSSDAVRRYLGQTHSRAALAEEANAIFEYARSFTLYLVGAERDGAFPRPAPASAPAPAGGFGERLESLSPSQKRAFDLLVTGLPNKLIAYELGLAESTVKAHMSALFRKLGVRSRTHAIAAAASVKRERGLVSEIASGAEILEGAPLAEPRTPKASPPAGENRARPFAERQQGAIR